MPKSYPHPALLSFCFREQVRLKLTIKRFLWRPQLPLQASGVSELSFAYRYCLAIMPIVAPLHADLFSLVYGRTGIFRKDYERPINLTRQLSFYVNRLACSLRKRWFKHVAGESHGYSSSRDCVVRLAAVRWCRSRCAFGLHYSLSRRTDHSQGTIVPELPLSRQTGEQERQAYWMRFPVRSSC